MRLLIDIETVPEDAEPGMTAPPPECWRYAFEAQPEARRKRLTGRGINSWTSALTAPSAELSELAADLRAVHDAAWERLRAASLDPMRGRVLCLGIAEDDRDAEVWTGEEVEILSRLSGLAASLSLGPNPEWRLVVHNAGFDLPFLAARAIRHGYDRLAGELHEPLAKPWDRFVTDTATAWPVTTYAGRRTGSARLDDVARHLGIDRAANPIDGSQVLDRYLAGDLEAIVAHCRDDVRVLRLVYAAERRCGWVP